MGPIVAPELETTGDSAHDAIHGRNRTSRLPVAGMPETANHRPAPSEASTTSARLAGSISERTSPTLFKKCPAAGNVGSKSPEP
jgi:hypothetical protein